MTQRFDDTFEFKSRAGRRYTLKISCSPGERIAPPREDHASEAAWEDALDLIIEAAQSGVCISLDGDEITFKAQFKLQDAMIARILENKYKIIELLRLNAAAPPDVKVDLH
jgi:hypothetical protein